MKPLMLLTCAFLSFFFRFNIFAQVTIGYKYDHAGNREERYIVLRNAKTSKILKPDSIVSENHDTISQGKSEQEKYEEKLGAYNVEIFPNPTQGELKIQITGSNSVADYEFLVYSLSGQLLIDKKTTVGVAVLDLSSYKAGTYILHIKAGDKTSQWKIIKQ